MEEYRPIYGYEGLYEVSDLGNVKSLIEWGGKNYRDRKEPLIMKQSKTTTGYNKVDLVKNRVKKSFKVHRLVAYSFLDRVEGKCIINHIDGNPINNKKENLEWCTQSENVQHAYDVGLKKYKVEKSLELELIKLYKEGVSIDRICGDCEISKTTLYRLLRKNGVDRIYNGTKSIKFGFYLEDVKRDIISGMKGIEIAKKYKCNHKLISVMKYNLKKEGKLNAK